MLTTRNKAKSGKRNPQQWKSNLRMGLGFPQKVKLSHKYHESVALTSTSGVIAFYKFACNGMYDPNITGTGHQPYYFDQMSGIYNHYTVVNSKIMVRVTPVIGGSVAFLFSLSQNDDATQTANTMDATAEQSSGQVQSSAPGQATSLPVLRNSWNARTVFGGDPLANDNLQGSVVSNPSELTVWSIGLQAFDGSSTIAAYVEVMIQYDAVWDEIKDIASS